MTSLHFGLLHLAIVPVKYLFYAINLQLFIKSCPGKNTARIFLWPLFFRCSFNAIDSFIISGTLSKSLVILMPIPYWSTNLTVSFDVIGWSANRHWSTYRFRLSRLKPFLSWCSGQNSTGQKWLAFLGHHRFFRDKGPQRRLVRTLINSSLDSPSPMIREVGLLQVRHLFESARKWSRYQWY